MNILSTLWILRIWCFITRASVATVLNTHPCVSRCLRVKCKLKFHMLFTVLNQHYTLALLVCTSLHHNAEAYSHTIATWNGWPIMRLRQSLVQFLVISCIGLLAAVRRFGIQFLVITLIAIRSSHRARALRRPFVEIHGGTFTFKVSGA